LSELDPELRLRLVVNDLVAFSKLCPAIKIGHAVQYAEGWTVASGPEASGIFRAERPRFIIECFACGRPDWYEEILFDPDDPDDRLIVNLEYLTAEDYAIDLHKAPSLTRSAKVKKAMFLPGFAQGTGGLIIDRRFAFLRDAYRDENRKEGLRQNLLAAIAAGIPAAAESRVLAGPIPADAPERFWVSIFSYERDYQPVVQDLAAFHRDRPLLALIAAGKSSEPFLDAWKRADRPFPAIALPFLTQETWDEVILASDFAIVRGEESLARAALSGRPFLWHAYRLEDDYQLVKVRALIDRMRPFFGSEDFSAIERAFITFNDRRIDSNNAKGADEGLDVFLERLSKPKRKQGSLETGFEAWSQSLFDLGNLARGLLTFIRDFE